QYVVDEIDGLGMRGCVRSFKTAALVDSDVYHDRALLHSAQHIATNQLRRRSARNQHRPDDQIGQVQRLTNGEAVGCQGHNLAAVDIIELTQAIEIAIDD